MEINVIDDLERHWTENYGPVVPRVKCGLASAFAISPKSLANADSLGEGVQNKQTICGRVVYPAADFFNWLRERGKK